ncbi:hypothetical protein C5F64_08790 [Photobacterium damselae subsp. damselae]|uniref:hypothetical protein n=1 Tax=Photobacterium damselae TaxID=38293 RepID=UPI000D061DCD|nr:hypothetical protein [Photobacterium damselae]PSB88086.1 hypothetical protein C5F64_08790 [Photobacterium damselae subsp. damselae]
MFLPPSMLEIVATLYDKLDVAQKLPRNNKLAYKDHRSLIRHQQAYAEMTARLLEYIAPKNGDEVKLYLGNSQRFLCTLNEAPFETNLSKESVERSYWKCIFAPMLATFLYHFEDEKYESNAIHFICKLLIKWEAGKKPAERAKWAKIAIKEQCEFKAPSFIQRVNDIRGGNIQSRQVINNNLEELNNEINLSNQCRDKVAAVYHAAMIIRRLEDYGCEEYLVYVKQYLCQLQTEDGQNGLLKTHKEICKVLFKNQDDLLLSWSSNPLIAELDEYIIHEIKPTYPVFLDWFRSPGSDIPWPDSEILKACIFDAEYIEAMASTPLSSALLDYYWMYYYVECGEFELAYQYCQEVEKASKNVHLGQYSSINLLHKIVLSWICEGKILHNQFDTEITTLIMNLPDRLECILIISPKFNEFILSLNDNELMMLRLFRLFNHYHRGQCFDPLSKLTQIIYAVTDVCTNGDDETDFLPVLKKKLDKNILRSKSVLPFTKKLSLTDSVDMVLELYHFVNYPIDEIIIKFSNDDRCKKLVVAFDID